MNLSYRNIKLWQVLSQGYAQSMYFIPDRSKYQSPTAIATGCKSSSTKKSAELCKSPIIFEMKAR